ncbi:MAG: sugar phosphate isomerase/epimerase [Planctomycetes bacterium]|nr:sugar phosphate isomerase/epimerase [Planctomycetota bacterium]
MAHHIDRREFLAVAAAGMAMGLSRTSYGQAPFKHTLHKALIGKPTEGYLTKIKEAGFEGVEAPIAAPAEAEKGRAIAEKLGMRIHSVLRGWAKFNSPKPEEVEGSIKTTEKALLAAQAYGADDILLVPCRIGGKGLAMPQPWEFRIQFDEKTGHLTSVVEGDNSKYKDYIQAHDHATDTSKAAIERLIPIAEKAGVVIAVENVWNNLWVEPHLCANFVDSFQSKWVRAYFDIGNHVKYCPPEKWVKVLGKRIVRCHVKDFKLNDDGHGGKFVNIRDGSVNWPALRKALDDVGYAGWMTIEGSGKLSMEERSKRLDLILAGK